MSLPFLYMPIITHITSVAPFETFMQKRTMRIRISDPHCPKKDFLLLFYLCLSRNKQSCCYVVPMQTRRVINNAGTFVFIFYENPRQTFLFICCFLLLDAEQKGLFRRKKVFSMTFYDSGCNVSDGKERRNSRNR